jgi:chromosome segregation ATPase
MLTKFESCETEELLKKLRHRNIELGCVDTLGVEIEKRLEDLLDSENELNDHIEALDDLIEALDDRIEALDDRIERMKRVLEANNLEVPE